jgi:site-specific recombinase XerD
MSNQRQPAWRLPRGIRLIDRPDRPSKFGVQWRVDGQRKTKVFETREDQITFARQLAGGVKRDGLMAYRLNEDETRQWRAFRATIGPNINLDDVARCWVRHGVTLSSMPLSEAIAAFLEAKAAEGVSKASLGHQRPILRRFQVFLNPTTNLAGIGASQIAAFMQSIASKATATRRSYQKTLACFFNWLKSTRRIADSPMEGMKLPKPTRAELKSVTVLSVEDGVSLFTKNLSADFGRELLGRLALECFAGIRHETAAQITHEAFDFKARVITIPARIDKNQRPQYIEHAEENLWAWLEWSRPQTWQMSKLMFRNHKSRAFTRANVQHLHNVLRHSAASYHIALHGDAGKTAAMLTHKGSTAMLYSHYRGAGGGKENGVKWFSIAPP